MVKTYTKAKKNGKNRKHRRKSRGRNGGSQLVQRVAQPTESVREDLVPQSGTLEDTLAVVRGHFGKSPSIVDATEAAISALASLLLVDSEGCLALVLEGPASSGKTTALSFFMDRKLKQANITHLSDSFTPAAFVSHAANVKKKDLNDIDLLPKIRHRGLIVPDLAPTLTARQEDLTKTLGTLTRVLDGQGYQSDSGTKGHRGHEGDHRFTFLAATTPLRPAAWKVLGTLGNRIVLLETGAEETETTELVESMRSEVTVKERIRRCSNEVGGFVSAIWKAAGGYGKVEWDPKADDAVLLAVIAKVAQWVVKCRGSTEVTYDSILPKISVLGNEAPFRLNGALYNLARGRAVAAGRRTLNREDVQLAVRVGLDSMPVDRRAVIRALLRSEDGLLSSTEVEKVLPRSRPTVLNTMSVLGALGAVELGEKDKATTIQLLDSERWLLEDDYRWVLARLPET